jgi:hypothetical protein
MVKQRWNVVQTRDKRRWRYVNGNGVKSRDTYNTRAEAVAAAFEAFAREHEARICRANVSD